MRKRLTDFVTFVPAVVFLVFAFSCGGGGEGGESPSGAYSSAQKETLGSLRKIDEAGYAYEIDYTADYKLDAMVGHKLDDIAEFLSKMKEELVPDSENEVTVLDLSGAFGCTAFSVSDADGKRLMGRNLDQSNGNPILTFVIHTAPEGKYASVGALSGNFLNVAADNIDRAKIRERLLYIPYMTLDGVNEKGLACAVLEVDCPEDAESDDAGRTPLLAFLVVRHLLDNCATVDDALAELAKFNVHPLFKPASYRFYEIDPVVYHWLIEDASGNSAIVEYCDSGLYVTKKGVDDKYQLCTNHIINEEIRSSKGIVAHDDDPSYIHFSAAEVKLSLYSDSAENMREEFLESALRSAGEGISTVYSQLFNLSDRTMKIWTNPTFDWGDPAQGYPNANRKYEKCYEFGLEYDRQET